MSWTVAETRDIETCLAIRNAVFVVEQGIALEDDVDGLDEQALHILLSVNDEPVGTARILVSNGVAKIGRVAVLKAHRGGGHGKSIMREAVALAKRKGLSKAKLGAQVEAVGFYEDLGFSPEGEEFLDAGMPHLMMSMDL